MLFATTLCLSAIVPFVVCTADSSNSTTPRFLAKALSVGSQLDIDGGPFQPFTLNSTSPLATLDYGTERAGFPFFHIAHVSQPLQVEVKYSEAFFSLSHLWSDGPYSFSTGLSNSFRVETFNITAPGHLTAPLLQGGQRWQSIRLLTPGTITFDQVAFDATTDTTEVQDLPGRFTSDDQLLNSIWDLGAVAASTACVEKGTQPATWQIDPEKGAFIRSQRASQSIVGPSFSNYTLSFDTMIDRGGVWWAMVRFSLTTSTSPLQTSLTCLSCICIGLPYGPRRGLASPAG